VRACEGCMPNSIDGSEDDLSKVQRVDEYEIGVSSDEDGSSSSNR
jgi:hypothetical protein